MRPGESKKVFLDTTFLLPFFQVEIEVDGFNLEKFEAFLSGVDEVHFSELSVYEAKATLFRLSRRDERYVGALEHFGENLAVLREDETIHFHLYSRGDDVRFNLISRKNVGLNVFDVVIVAQALDTGLLVTEDREILSLRSRRSFQEDSELRELKIVRWRELV